MRAPIVDDDTNLNRIGDANNPGLRRGALTREEHRIRLEPYYQGRPWDLDDLLDLIYGPEGVEATKKD